MEGKTMLSTDSSAAPPRLILAGERAFDRRGYYRAPVTQPSYRLGKEPPNKGMKLPPEVLTAEEVYALIDACGRGPAGRRNRALLVVMWRAGLRISEALSLYPKDVDLENGRITILHGKGDKRRVVAIDPAAAAILEGWSRERQKLGLTGRHFYFCVISEPTRGQELGSAYVRALCKQLAARAGIEKRVHPHGLRHTYAAHLGEHLAPHYVQRMLGHTSLAVTVRYLDHLSPSQAVEAVRAVPWPEPERSLASSR
jgi:integrase/recombinase XerD